MNEQNLWSVAFPTLDETQIHKLASCTNAEPKVFHDGEKLFSVGDRNISFFIVKSGDVDIIDESGDQPKTLVVHHPGQFTGDVSHVTGLPVIVSAVARGECRGIRDPRRLAAARSESVPDGERHHSAGVHRAAAAIARVSRLHGAAGDRLAIFAGHVPGTRFSIEESHSFYVGGSGVRSACGSVAEAVRGHGVGHAGGGLPVRW